MFADARTRTTYRYECARAVASGIVETASNTFLLLIAVQWFAAGPLAKAAIAAGSGLGYVLWDAYYVGRMDVVIADMASIGIMGFLSDRIIVFIAGRVLHWKQFQSH